MHHFNGVKALYYDGKALKVINIVVIIFYLVFIYLFYYLHCTKLFRSRDRLPTKTLSHNIPVCKYWLKRYVYPQIILINKDSKPMSFQK